MTIRGGTPRRRSPRRDAFLATLVAGAALALVAGCGKKGSTAPPPTQPAAAVSFNSGVFSSSSPVKVFVHTFPTAGSFGYRCSVHGGSMSGGVQVDPVYPESAFVTVDDNFFSPTSAQVRPGGYVKWVAAGGNHGVRSN